MVLVKCQASLCSCFNKVEVRTFIEITAQVCSQLLCMRSFVVQAYLLLQPTVIFLELIHHFLWVYFK